MQLLLPDEQGQNVEHSHRCPHQQSRDGPAEDDEEQGQAIGEAVGHREEVLAGHSAEALPYAREAARLGARSAPFAYHLGMIELATGDRAAARTDLGRALAINPIFSPREAPRARAALAGLES